MVVECAACERYACRAGRIDAAPDGCPMHGPFPEFDLLYASEDVRRLHLHATRVEGEGYGRWPRIREVVEVATRMGYRRIGVAHGPETGREALLAAGWLEAAGLEVVLPEHGACDPVGQAERFRSASTDLNVIVGMCVGHDALFVRHSSAPVTCLVVRDLRLRHNPAAALYTRTGYLKPALYGRGGAPDDGAPPRTVRLRDMDDATLDRLARGVREAGRHLDPPPCRVEEIMTFAHRAGATHLGLVFCSGFREEARHLTAVLGTNGFRVSSACCKTGAVPKERIGIEDAGKVRPGRPEMLCNPLAQAHLLEGEDVDLVLLMGQCVGHDSLTLARLRTPAVFVVAKDRLLAHNTAAALYTDDGETAPGGAAETLMDTQARPHDLDRILSSIRSDGILQAPDVILAAVERPDWGLIPTAHDWREHVPPGLRDAWETLSMETRLCVFEAAEAMATEGDVGNAMVTGRRS